MKTKEKGAQINAQTQGPNDGSNKCAPRAFIWGVYTKNGLFKFSKINPQISDSRYASGTLISGPHRGGVTFFGRYLQCTIKELKIEVVHLLERSFRTLRGISYLDTGTLQDTGHLLGRLLIRGKQGGKI